MKAVSSRVTEISARRHAANRPASVNKTDQVMTGPEEPLLGEDGLEVFFRQLVCD